MLDAFIIEKIKREQEQQAPRQRPQLEIPRGPERPSRPGSWDDDDRRDREPTPDRGVVIIEF